MAIGDFWDTSYNPSYEFTLKNARTGKSQWVPDMSDIVPQWDTGTLKSRNKGRFCSEGCGCVNTGCDSMLLAKGQYGCHLPPELAVTVVRDPNGRYSAKSTVEGGGGETIHLKYSNGSWRGRRCCTNNAYGKLEYACDPCKVTTLPNGKPSECHYANNKYESFDKNDPISQRFDQFTIRDDFDYDKALKGEGNWPRVGENAWLRLSVYNSTAPTTGTEMLRGSTFDGFADFCFDASGLPVKGIGDESACEANKGYHWSPQTPIYINNDINDEDDVEANGGHIQLIGREEHPTKFSIDVKSDEVITNIKSREKTIKVTKDGYLDNYSISNGAEPNERVGTTTLSYHDPSSKDRSCLVDGSTPLKKRPYCRNPITGKRLQQRCEEITGFNPAFGSSFSLSEEKEDCEATKSSINGYCSISDPATQQPYTDEASCNFAGGTWVWEDNKWLYDDQTTCEDSGACLAPKTDKFQSQEDRIVEPYCLDIVSGTKDPVPRNKAECEAQGNGIWKLEDAATCAASYKEGAPACNDADGKDTGHADEDSCLAAGNTWMKNEWFSNQWVDWEYEKLSCCGETILDHNYPSRTPQISGSTLSARKNPSCTTPYHEVILSPYQAGHNIATEATHNCLAAVNQWQRDDGPDTEFFMDTVSYWTLVIRPCNFHGGCYDENVKRPDPQDLKDNKLDNYYDTTCGEEIVLYLSTDQLVNCSNLNLTIENESQIRSGWKETQPMWHTSIGDKKGNPATLQFLLPGADSSMVGGNWSTEYSYPGNAMYKEQYKWWCNNPDVNVDGRADGYDPFSGESGHCSQYHYWNSGAPKSQLAHPKGVDAFYAFNLQPQPFKATEEKQNRAKTLYHAAVDHKAWETCASYILGDSNGGGHWFWNYGPDYFMYFDFLAHDEVRTYPAPATVIKDGGKCEAIAKAAKAYVDGKVGFLRRGDCGYGNGALWVGWLPYDSWTNNGICGDCEGQGKSECGSKGGCLNDDGSFETGQTDCSGKGQCNSPIGTKTTHATEDECDSAGGNWSPAEFVSCCEFFEECDRRIITNRDAVIAGTENAKYRDAVDKAECEKSADNGGAGGQWTEGCIPTVGQRAQDQLCGEVQNVPEDFVDVVLGGKVGTCQLQKDGEDVSTPDTSESDCAEESMKHECRIILTGLVVNTPQAICELNPFTEWVPVYDQDPAPSFVPEMIGHYASTYPRRENEVVKLRKAGPLTGSLADVSGLKGGFNTNPAGFPAGDAKENSLNYWHLTGLYPKGETASFVSDGCVGVSHSGRIEHASNTDPIKITSRSHGLINGDLIMTRGVLGNFGANVFLSQRDVQETQWEDKLYSACTGENCDEQTYPSSECLFVGECKDASGDNTGINNKLECTSGSCTDGNGNASTTADGEACSTKADCEFPREAFTNTDDEGNCPPNYKVDPEKAPGEDDGCILQGKPGCGGTFNSATGNTWSTKCPDEFLACYGIAVPGSSEPQYAPFAVVQNATADTFDLYTCDNLPLKGSLTKDAIKNMPEKVDSNGVPIDCAVGDVEVCYWGYGIPGSEGYFGGENNPLNPPPLAIETEIVEDGAVNNGRPSVGKWAGRCISYDSGETINQPDNARSEYKFNPFLIVNGAPINENYTCDGTIPDGGHYCGPKDCDDRYGTWMTKQEMADNVLTQSKVEGSKQTCESYGLCNVIKNAADHTPKSIMTQSDCTKLAKVFHTLDLNAEYSSSSQIYAERCQDIDGNIDNSDKIQLSGDIQAACTKHHGVCKDPATGDTYSSFKTKESCENNGLDWKDGVYINKPNDCVNNDLSGDAAYAGCWQRNTFGVELPSMNSSAGNTRPLPNYPVCPYTGTWEIFHQDLGVEAGYFNPDQFDSLYRFGWSGLTRRWEERANDYYIQIEQKGICPVCCDHFMPETLTATLTDTDSSLQDFINGCPMDPCEAGDFIYDSETTNWKWKYGEFTNRFDGYCCSDFYHSCNIQGLGQDLTKCTDKPSNFGACYRVSNASGQKPGLLTAYKKDDCERLGSGAGGCSKSGICTINPQGNLTPEDCSAAGGTWSPISDETGCTDAGGTWTASGGHTKFYPLPDGNCEFPNPFVDAEGNELETIPDDAKTDKASCEREFCTFDSIDNQADCESSLDSNGNPAGYKWQRGTWVGKNKMEVAHDCEDFLRKRPTQEFDPARPETGRNCRKCSNLYSDQDRIPIKEGYGECCDCLVNHRDAFAFSRYPTCEYAIDALLPDCTPDNEGQAFLLGTEKELTAVCKKATGRGPQGNDEYHYWSFDPCQCFPQHVPHKCLGDHIPLESGNSCEDDGVVIPENNIGGCYNSSNALILTKTIENGASCKDGIGSIVFYCTVGNPDTQEAITDQSSCTAAGGSWLKITDRDQCESVAGRVWNTTAVDCDTSAGEYFKAGSHQTCSALEISTDAYGEPYAYANSAQHQYETCPGLGIIDVQLKYDGSVWRSDWTQMGAVGLKQCKMDQHRFTFSANCKSTGADPNVHPNYQFSSANVLVAQNADCGNCDAAQYTYEGVRVDGIDWFDGRYREHETPSVAKDGHYIRLVMGCGNSVSSITPQDGMVKQGGFGGNILDYRDNGIQIYAQIANCTFYDFNASEGLRFGRVQEGVSGTPPCLEGTSCISKKSLLGGDMYPPKIPKRGSDERKYSFAGRCIDAKRSCGNQGPCAKIKDCCTYTGIDIPLQAGLDGQSFPLWSGGVACTTGGDIEHRCSAWGYDPYPKKPAETFTVYYVKEIHDDGSATLVVNTGSGCSWPKGSVVGIGQANLLDAENDDFGSTTRNNMPRNPFLPAGATNLLGSTIYNYEQDISVGAPSDRWEDYGLFDSKHFYTEYPISEDGPAIPDGRSTSFTLGKPQRGNTSFMEIRVASIEPLISKNPRQNRHLKIYDRSGITNSGGTFNPKDADMLPNRKYAHPFGINPWPVAVQNQSSSGRTQDMWPKGVPMGWDNTEHLRKDPVAAHIALGRIGLKPTVENLNMLSVMNEVSQGDTTTPIPLIMPTTTVMINSIDNVYATDQEDGNCIGKVAYTKQQCESGGTRAGKWVPRFLYTKATTGQPHDISDGEKIVISGSVAYPATCMGTRLGYCHGDITLNINECMEGVCKDVQHPAGFGIAGGTITKYHIDPDTNKPWTTEYDCSAASEKKKHDLISNGWDPDGTLTKDLVFTPNGEWNQVYEDSEADEQICEAFGGGWVIGKINNEKDKKGFYKDALNDSPLELENKEKDFVEGCPVNCQINGFMVQDACTSHYDNGQCYECLLLKVKDEFGSEKEEVRCPRAAHDGMYIARTNPNRYCQNSNFNPLIAFEEDESERNRLIAASKSECIAAGFEWYGDAPLSLTEDADGNKHSFEIALHGEMNMDFVDGAKIWGSERVPPRAATKRDVKSDWQLDVEVHEGTIVDPMGDFKDDANYTVPITKTECLTMRDHVWIGTYTPRPPSPFSNTQATGTENQTPKTSSAFSSAFGYKNYGQAGTSPAPSITEELIGECVNIRKIREFMENWTPRTNNTGASLIETGKFLEEDIDGNSAKIVSSLQDACIRSDNCQLRKQFGWCMDLTETTVGTCYTYSESSASWREDSLAYNKCTDIFVGQEQVIGSNTLTTAMSKIEACATKGMQAYGGGTGQTVSSTAVVYDFECMSPQGGGYQPTTGHRCMICKNMTIPGSMGPTTKEDCEVGAGGQWVEETEDHSGNPITNVLECEIQMGGEWEEYDIPPANPVTGAGMTERVCREIALGYPIYKNNVGEVISPAPEYGPSTMNTGIYHLELLSSKEAIAMGHETGIGQSERLYKGVIYAPNIEKNVFMKAEDVRTYTTYGVNEGERAVWSRHGGSFDIIIGYPPPENNCRDANGDQPVNLDWHLGFDQICCNVRGPLAFYQCADRCFHHYEGPLITDLEFDFGDTGISQLKVNVHE